MTAWWNFGIEGQLYRRLLAGDDLTKAVGHLHLKLYYLSERIFDNWRANKDDENLMRGHLYDELTERSEYRIGDQIRDYVSLSEKLRIDSLSGATLTRAVPPPQVAAVRGPVSQVSPLSRPTRR